MPVRAQLGPLVEREFRLFFFGQAISLLGSGLAPVALAFAVLDLTGSPADLGLVLAAQTVAQVAFLLIGGVLGDRFSRRAVMLTSDLVRFGSQAATAALVVTGDARLWQLIVLQAVGGAAAGCFQPAARGLVPQLVGEREWQQANALQTLTQAIGNVAGPVLAGVLVATVGAGWALAADAASFAASAAFLAALRLAAADRVVARNFVGDLAEGWRDWWQRRWLVLANLNATLLNVLVIAPFLVLGPAVAKHSLGSASAWALIMTGYGIGSLVGSLAALRLHARRPVAVALSVGVVYAPLLLLLARHLDARLIAVVALLAGVQGPIRGTLLQTTGLEQIPPALLARVSSFGILGSIGFAPLGFALAGVLGAGALGVSGTLTLAAGGHPHRGLPATPYGRTLGTSRCSRRAPRLRARLLAVRRSSMARPCRLRDVR